MSDSGEPRPRRRYHRVIEQMGKPWVFWPVMLGGSVLSRGPSVPWPNVWAWAVAVLLLGPVLAAALWVWYPRPSTRRSPS